MGARSFILVLIVFGVLWFGREKLESSPKRFHSNNELIEFKKLTASNELNSIFKTSEVCKGCHGFDPTGIASRDSNGLDINVYDDWATSMMGLSAKDPYWRAKVAHETFKLPDLKLAIESKCTQCHAPMGHYQALYENSEYNMSILYGDTLGLDGVSCMLCHSISTENLGQTFSGDITLDTFRLAYGPYPFPFDAPMTDFVGVRPLYSFHIFDAGICADCHTLITNSYSLEGEPTNETFVEQATYHEWLNSKYVAEGTTCQSCHMEELRQSIVVASGISALEPREYYRLHNFNGANVQMLNAIKNNLDYLNIGLPDSLFDESIESARDNLQNRSVELTLESCQSTDGVIQIAYQLKNKTGHKFPSGYPARRAYLEFVLENEMGDTIFHSGKRKDHRILPEGTEYFPHFQLIDDDQNTQVYQIVNVDTEGKRTNGLLRAYESIKDNRLTPIGFSSAHSTYDTVRILGNASFDPDFNLSPTGTEGTGADIIEYHINKNDYPLEEGVLYKARIQLWYESIPLQALDSLQTSGLSEVDTLNFVLDGSYDPVLVASYEKDSIGLIVSTDETIPEDQLEIFPNPFSDLLTIRSSQNIYNCNIEIIDINGRIVRKVAPDNGFTEYSISTQSLLPGIYFLKLSTNGLEMENYKLIKY